MVFGVRRGGGQGIGSVGEAGYGLASRGWGKEWFE